MPAASSGPYQSRIFNFLHKQSRRVSEQLGSTFRHFQVATSWGAQAILYPLYLLFQSTESAGKQLRSSKHQSWLPLPVNDGDAQPQTPPIDQPIQRVLQLVREGGIATNLSTNTLVLVTAENEILDILTPQQQQELEERIIGEVAEYWHCWQLAAANKSIHSAPVLGFLDRTVAKLESTQLVSVSADALSLVHRSWELVVAVPTQLMSRSSKTLIDNTQPAALAKLNGVIAPDTQPDQFKIYALIWAAIDYFFGDRGEPKLEQTAAIDNLERGSWLQQLARVLFNLPLQPFGSKLKQPQVIDNDTNPWLTVSDLFSTSKTKGKPVKQHNKALSASRLINLDLFLSSRRSKKQILAQTAISKVSSVTSARSKNKQLGDIVQNNNPHPSSSSVSHDLLHSNSSTQIDPAPDWIEIQATVVGYVKHPLEQLLQWLDHILLWIEELLIKALEWAQQRTTR